MPTGKLYFDYYTAAIQRVIHHRGMPCLCLGSIAWRRVPAYRVRPPFSLTFICIQFNHIDVLCQTHRRYCGFTRKYIAINLECDCMCCGQRRSRRSSGIGKRYVNVIWNIVCVCVRYAFIVLRSTYLNKYRRSNLLETYTTQPDTSLRLTVRGREWKDLPISTDCVRYVWVATVRLQCNPDVYCDDDGVDDNNVNATICTIYFRLTDNR